MDEVAEIAAWCSCVGIPMLSVYEKTGMMHVFCRQAERLIEEGVLKAYIPTVHRTVTKKIHSYFGRYIPSLQVRAPHVPSYLNGGSPEEGEVSMSSGMSTFQKFQHIGLTRTPRPPLYTSPIRRGRALNARRLD